MNLEKEFKELFINERKTIKNMSIKELKAYRRKLWRIVLEARFRILLAKLRLR